MSDLVRVAQAMRRGRVARLKSICTLLSCILLTIPFARVARAEGDAALPRRDTGTINLAAYGARCDGRQVDGAFVGTDDTAAINAAFAALRARRITGLANAWPIGGTGKLVGPGGVCIVSGTINATGLYGGGMEADLSGTVILGRTGDTPVVDATGSGGFRFTNLAIQGDCAANTPKTGLVLGRITNNGVGADHNYLDRPVINGCFTLAAYLNVASETTLIQAGSFFNWQAGGYGAIWDGINHWDFHSAFYTQRLPRDARQSFNENVCISCIIASLGDGGIPAWFSNTTRHQFIRSFFTTSNRPTAPAVPGLVLFYGAGSIIQQLDLGAHFESVPTLRSIVRFEGSGAIELGGLRLVDQYPESHGSIFEAASGVTSVTIEDADLHIYEIGPAGGTWFDDPGKYTLAGSVAAHSSTGWTQPRGWSGTTCFRVTCRTTAGGAAIADGRSSVGQAPAGVAAITLVRPGKFDKGDAPLPGCVVSPPTPGGTTAKCQVKALEVLGFGQVSVPGVGYSVGDVLHQHGGRCESPPGLRVLAVDGKGGITRWTGLPGYCTVTPPWPTLMDGGTGTGARMDLTAFKAAGVTVTDPGSGYTAPPSITLSFRQGRDVPAVAEAELATAAPRPVPTTATADAGTARGQVGQRASATGTALTVSPGVTWLRLVQAGSITAQAITLPSGGDDGQMLRISTLGQIGSLTLTGAKVLGWQRGPLAAGSSIVLGWDASLQSWLRVQ